MKSPATECPTSQLGFLLTMMMYTAAAVAMASSDTMMNSRLASRHVVDLFDNDWFVNIEKNKSYS